MTRKELGIHVANLISADRNSVHGDPHKQFDRHMKLMSTMANDSKELNNTQMHSVIQITTKLSRIATGNPNHRDHWMDIAGYALIAAESCK